jgi:hypothetical protein
MPIKDYNKHQLLSMIIPKIREKAFSLKKKKRHLCLRGHKNIRGFCLAHHHHHHHRSYSGAHNATSNVNLLYFYISTLQSMCAVPNMAVF